MKWKTTTYGTDMKIIHIVPEHDVLDHDHDKYCPCNPTREEGDTGVMFIHHSFDGREAVEWANEILKN